MKKTLLMLACTLLLTACSDETYEKAREDAKFALANGEYEQALGLYELAYMENPDDLEAKAMFDSLMKLHEVRVLYEDDEWGRIIKQIDLLSADGKLPAQLKRPFQQVYKEASDMQNKQTGLEGIVGKAEAFIAEKEFEQARNLLDDQKADVSMARVVEKNETKILSLYEQIEVGLGVKKAATEKNQALSTRTVYTDKLNQIEKSLAELDYLYVDGVTANMMEAESETFERWDNALNDIYGVLKTTLSASEMDLLRNEQRDWILFRDHEAETAAAEFKGGSFEMLTLVSVKQQLTKERCYRLVDVYME